MVKLMHGEVISLESVEVETMELEINMFYLLPNLLILKHIFNHLLNRLIVDRIILLLLMIQVDFSNVGKIKTAS
jgi:hypothetical protein